MGCCLCTIQTAHNGIDLSVFARLQDLLEGLLILLITMAEGKGARNASLLDQPLDFKAFFPGARNRLFAEDGTIGLCLQHIPEHLQMVRDGGCHHGIIHRVFPQGRTYVRIGGYTQRVPGLFCRLPVHIHYSCPPRPRRRSREWNPNPPSAQLPQPISLKRFSVHISHAPNARRFSPSDDDNEETAWWDR